MVRKFFVAAVAVVGACSTPPLDRSVHGSWRIEDVDGGGVIDASRLEITLTPDGRVTGHSGCNSFSGTYAADDGEIEFGALVSTRRACAAEALMMQEQRVLNSLNAVASYAFNEHGALILTGPAPAHLRLLRMNEAATALSVSGDVIMPQAATLPPDAVLRVTAQDVAPADAPAVELARVETPAGADGAMGFALEIPRAELTPQSRVAVRAQILSGPAILYTSTSAHDVALEGEGERLRIPLTAVDAASGGMIGPAPRGYSCGGERVQIAFETGAAYLTIGGQTLRLPRQSADHPEDPEATRRFSDGRYSLRQAIEGRAPRVFLARGRAAFVPCMQS